MKPFRMPSGNGDGSWLDPCLCLFLGELLATFQWEMR